MNQRIVSILIQIEIVIFLLGLQEFVIGSTVETAMDNNKSSIGGANISNSTLNSQQDLISAVMKNLLSANNTDRLIEACGFLEPTQVTKEMYECTENLTRDNGNSSNNMTF
jgi:hypothetical protein